MPPVQIVLDDVVQQREGKLGPTGKTERSLRLPPFDEPDVDGVVLGSVRRFVGDSPRPVPGSLLMVLLGMLSVCRSFRPHSQGSPFPLRFAFEQDASAEWRWFMLLAHCCCLHSRMIAAGILLLILLLCFY